MSKDEISDFFSYISMVEAGNVIRKSLQYFSGEEIYVLKKYSPKNQCVWYLFGSELQTLLSNMDRARKLDSSMGRPKFTVELAKAIGAITRLRMIEERGCHSIQAFRLRGLILHDDWVDSLSKFHENDVSVNKRLNELIATRSAIQLLELYRDELVKPPRLRSRRNFDEYQWEIIETGDFNWMDDAGKSYLQDIRDIPLITIYDDMPNLNSVLDWFVATKPVFDKNQLKRGWPRLEKLSDDWHRNDAIYESYAELIENYPSWNCLCADYYESWLAIAPPNSPYKLVPLVTPSQLLDESRSMRHCVVTYIDECNFGNVRIFSVRDAESDKRIATLELQKKYDVWKVAQLKGKHNLELINTLYSPDDLLAHLLNKFAGWYNLRSGISS